MTKNKKNIKKWSYGEFWHFKNFDRKETKDIREYSKEEQQQQSQKKKKDELSAAVTC